MGNDPAWWSGLQLTRHAADKLETYGIDGARLESWRAADERTVTNRRGAGRWIYPAN